MKSPAEPTARVFIDRRAIEHNLRTGAHSPVVAVQDQDGVFSNAHEVVIYGHDGREAARVVYRPEGLGSGSAARVWIETYADIEPVHTPEG